MPITGTVTRCEQCGLEFRVNGNPRHKAFVARLTRAGWVTNWNADRTYAKNYLCPDCKPKEDTTNDNSKA